MPCFWSPTRLITQQASNLWSCSSLLLLSRAVQPICDNKQHPFSRAAPTVPKKIIGLHDISSISAVTVYRVIHLITSHYESYSKLRKSFHRDKDKPTIKLKLDNFWEKGCSLFDIMACSKCVIVANECSSEKSPDTSLCPVSVNCIVKKGKKFHLWN